MVNDGELLVPYDPSSTTQFVRTVLVYGSVNKLMKFDRLAILPNITGQKVIN